MTTSSLPATQTLRIVDLSKAYGSTQALRGLSLSANSGRIVGVVGANGAGKSTLMKLLAGEEKEDRGLIAVDDSAWPLERRRRSVAVVHQEPQLFPYLTVAENLMIENAGLLRPKPTAAVFDFLRSLEIDTLADTPLERTSVAVWQRTEIARALLRDAAIFLFDEPNSALTKEESEQLFVQMQTLSKAGRFVFLVSHRLGEVAEICEEVFVMRDGAVVSALAGPEITSDRLSSLLSAELSTTSVPLGRDILSADGEPTTATTSGQATPTLIAEPSGTTTNGSAHTIPSLEQVKTEPSAPEVRTDRVEGISGLVLAVTSPEGGGGRECTRAARQAGSAAPLSNGSKVRRPGRAYMSPDRRQCLFFNMSVAGNITARLRRLELKGHPWFINRRVLARTSQAFIERFGVKTASPGAAIGSLSGGNQQKVVVASALAVEPALLIVEEPTRGVDVQTKRHIYEILTRYARGGGAVVMFVTELEDAIGCADYLYVVRDRAIVGVIKLATAGGLEELSINVTRLLSRDPRDRVAQAANTLRAGEPTMSTKEPFE